MEIKEIKSRLTIQAVLSRYGMQADRNGMAKCPFHDDKTPSMKTYPQTNSFHCFGCGKAGDAIEFIQQKEGCNKHQALVKAAELAGGNGHAKRESPNRLEPSRTSHAEILAKAFAYFQRGLANASAKKAHDYLSSRGLDASYLEIGYNSGQFHHRGKLSERDTEACVNAGLLSPYKGSVPNAKGTVYTAFAKDCITFPLKNKEGEITGIYGRRTDDSTKNKHYYLKERQGLYPHYPDAGTTKLILAEAVIDAATLLQISEVTAEYGILACYGTNGLTGEHLQAIKELECLAELVFFFDGDKAGKDAIRKYHIELSGSFPHLKLSAVKTPKGEDVNSLAAGHGPELFPYLLGKRQPIGATETTEPEPPRLPGKFDASNPDFINYEDGNLKITVLGGINLQQIDRLRVTVKVSRKDTSDPLHSIRHTLDLYHSDYLEKFIGKASEQLETGTNLLKRAMAELTGQLESYRLSKVESLKERKPKERQLSEQRYKKALAYLKAPKLMERTSEDIGKAGMIGEESNRLLMYLIFTSRLREQPLHIISLGASGTGKTYLQEKVSELIPEHDKLEITMLSENAFYYFGQRELRNKLVLIEDMDGAEHVLYPLRELQSKKRISKTIPIKDNKGNLKTITVKVEGPICLAGTTTKEKLYEDNANRSLLVYLDGSKGQKGRIMDYQRKLSAGKANEKREKELTESFKDMQTILKPIKVRNPYAERLAIPEHVFKPLRTNSHYLAFIETVTFYHQCQREVKTDRATGERYIETELEDIEWANRLLKDVLLAKADELSGECRRFFENLKAWLSKDNKESFYKSEVREAFRMNPNNLKYYLVQLMRYDYLKVVGGNRHKSGYEYEIANGSEYSELKGHLDNALDAALANIRESMAGSEDNRRVTEPVTHSSN